LSWKDINLCSRTRLSLFGPPQITATGKYLITSYMYLYLLCRCGNVAAILELDENLNRNYKIFEAAPQVKDHHPLLRKRLLIARFVNNRKLVVSLQKNQLPIISYNNNSRRMIYYNKLILYIQTTNIIQVYMYILIM
jgi:hypothetical protein